LALLTKKEETEINDMIFSEAGWLESYPTLHHSCRVDIFPQAVLVIIAFLAYFIVMFLS
jgi:hypothetical protein